MTTTHTQLLRELAARLDNAERTQTPTLMLSREHTLSLADAYNIQHETLAARLARGDVQIGYKMGLTSRAKMLQVGVHEPIRGYLTRDMQLADGAELSRAQHIHPRVEPELAFVTAAPIHGPTTAHAVAAAIATVAPALEIIDSRYKDFEFALPDVVADNASGSRFVVGDRATPLSDVDVSNLGMVMEIDGVPVEFASSAAIMDHPLRSVAALANLLATRDQHIPAGSVIIAGAATNAVPFGAGQRVRLRVEGLGTAQAWMGA
ncbi:MAG: fumarylacetoacetate hydrolase family protein [Myxococcales bacterium]|nr:fumarylacetoacetate hydrolase family protein [Myxococcales bacterium]MCB9533236.1 fumarylacetoacetate hydrolase family protein [Myxococcales bacterium]